MSKAIIFGRIPTPGEPTQAQKDAGNYRKRKVEWAGLTISIENEGGTFRRGVARDGTQWATLLPWSYGYVNRSTGMDGDQVDVYLGPMMDVAEMVYVVHQRKYGNWDAYDEDKCMLGFLSEEDATAAFLACYDNPKFLGPVTAMPVAEFVAKVRATKDAPSMIKSVLLLSKSIVGSYLRRGHIVRSYATSRSARAAPNQRQLIVFPTVSMAPPEEPVPASTPPGPSIVFATPPAEEVLPEGQTRAFYSTMVRGPTDKPGSVAWLAGPFGTHEEAIAHVEPARSAAVEMNAEHHFHSFGTASRVAASHPAGRLNAHLGLN